MKHRIRHSVIAAVACVGLAVATFSGSALAFSNGSSAPAQMAAGGLPDWDWPNLIQSGNGNAADIGTFSCTGYMDCSSFSAFDPHNSSYVIGYNDSLTGWETPYCFGTGAGHPCYSWVIDFSQNSAQLGIVPDGSGGFTVKSSDGRNLNEVAFTDMGGFINSIYGGVKGLIVSDVTKPYESDLYGIYSVHNITYDPSWTGPLYNTQISYSSGGGSGTGSPSCSALDISCYLANIWQGVTTAVANFGSDLLAGFTTLFFPTGSELSGDWSAFYSAMVAHLGFLLWPFTFVVNVFTAIITPTTTCCTIGAGTFMGATTAGIDLTYVSTHLPVFWTAITVAVRGLIVFELVYYLRRKYLEITQK